MTRAPLPLLALLAALSPAAAAPPPAEQAPLVYAVVVGNNDGLGRLPQLRYADDDALRFYRFATQLAPPENVALLTELDVTTWRRIQLSGATPPPFLPPTRARLLEVIRLFKAQIARVRREQPDRPVHFYFFFSGHGEQGYFFLKRKGGPLAEAAFTGSDLQRTFVDSPATLNWLFIDACKSQSLFVAKGRAEEDDELGPDFSGLIKKLDLAVARAPVGVLTSTLSDRPAGEARDIRGGYFSHVLTSGLRGAADANSDGVLRYGELAAFVTFHTRRIAGQRPWFHPPRGRLDEPLVLLAARPNLLELPPGLGGHFAVFDGAGENLLLELHKTEAQHSRLILAPGAYQVVWLRGEGTGRQAKVTITAEAGARLLLRDFGETVELGRQRVPKGEGMGAPPEEDPAAGSALARFEPDQSGFDQPFTPRVVEVTTTAYISGGSSGDASPAATVAAAPGAPAAPPRHHLGLGFGYYAPPVSPLASGLGVSLGYAYSLSLPLDLGARALLAFSEHPAGAQGRPFSMQRLALQAEAAYRLPRIWRLQAFVGAYLGWQLTLITQETLIREGEEDRLGTVISGDAAGMRAGLLAGVRLPIWAGLWLSASGAWGVELLHQSDEAGANRSETFLRPQAYLQVGYAF